MAYEFNGSNQRLSTASAPVTAAPLTMACWFRTTAMSSLGCLISLMDRTVVNNYFLMYFRGDIAGDPIQLIDESSNPFSNQRTVNSTSGVTSGQWHHACAVQTSTTSRTIYLDAGNSASNAFTIQPKNINRLNIGAADLNGATGLFNGQIAEVGVWNAALTAAEIASIADGMTCDKVRPQSLVFYAPLVRDLIDVKGGLTITNNNTATVANHTRVYA